MNAPMMIVDASGRAQLARDVNRGAGEQEDERSQAEGATKATFGRMPLSVVAGFVLWSAFVAVAGALFAMHVDASRLQSELVMRPPVVVIDTMDWIQNAGVGRTPAERYADGAARLKAAVAGLHSRGAIVFDSTSAFSYPNAVKLDAPRPQERNP